MAIILYSIKNWRLFLLEKPHATQAPPELHKSLFLDHLCIKSKSPLCRITTESIVCLDTISLR